MNRSDQRKEMGAGLARTPAEARRDEEPIASGGISRERSDPEGDEGPFSSNARTVSASKRGAEEHAQYEERSQEGEHTEVRSGHGIGIKSVEADFVMGEGGKSRVRTATAEGEPDMASAKANRKEAMEPEREEEEKAVIGRDRNVAHKNAMGHGEREVIARNTI